MAIPNVNQNLTNTSIALASIGDYGSSSENEDDNNMEQQKNPLEKAINDQEKLSLNHNAATTAIESSSVASSLVTDILSNLIEDTKMLQKPESFQIRQINDENELRTNVCSSSSSDSSSSSLSSNEDSSSESDSTDDEDSIAKKVEDKELSQKNISSKKQGNTLKVKGEMCNSDLPPIEDLHISVPEFECVHLGKISSMVDDLVVVKAFPNTPAIDLDSVLFLDKGKRPLGKVFDVIGPVTSPFYCLRFNSSQHIKDNNVKVDLDVYYAPRTEHTSFVFVEQLRRMKGSDASWKDDVEPQKEHIDYSDDEDEKSARRTRKKLFQKHEGGSNAGPSDVEIFRDNNTYPDSKPEEQRRILKAKRAYKPPNPSQQGNNAFYRNTKRYNPRNGGPIRWDSIQSRNTFSNMERVPTNSYTNTIYRHNQSIIPNMLPFSHNDARGFHSSFNQKNQGTSFPRPPPPRPAYDTEFAGYQKTNQIGGSHISGEPVSYNSQAIYSHQSSLSYSPVNSTTGQGSFSTDSYNYSQNTWPNVMHHSSLTSPYQFHTNPVTNLTSASGKTEFLQPHQFPPPPMPTSNEVGILEIHASNYTPKEENLLPPGT